MKLTGDVKVEDLQTCFVVNLETRLIAVVDDGSRNSDCKLQQ